MRLDQMSHQPRGPGVWQRITLAGIAAEGSRALVYGSQGRGSCGGCVIRTPRLPHPQARTVYCSVQRASRCWLEVEDGNGSGSSALPLPGSLPAQTPSSGWGLPPGSGWGRGGWRRQRSIGSAVAWEFATRTPSSTWDFSPPHPKTRTLRSVMPLRVRVLGLEDDLRTLTPSLIEEVGFAWAVSEVRCTVGDDPCRTDVASVSALWRV